ncbi:RNA polymerase sigma-70 factor [Puteibacter caeruleilacunae]|nr:RNA polymerase sigma-70 factor [Puteibacter caeruleilacunae]
MKNVLSGQSKLILELQRGDKKAYQNVYYEYYERLVHLGRTYLQSNEEAKEVVQDAFMKLWEIRQNLQPDSNIRNFLFTLVKNSCLNRIKQRQTVIDHHNKLIHLQLQYSFESLSKMGYDYMEIEELKSKIETAIENLPEHCRKVFCMSRFEELKNREIAERLDVSQKTVEAHLTKALKILRTELKDYLPLLALISFEYF